GDGTEDNGAGGALSPSSLHPAKSSPPLAPRLSAAEQQSKARGDGRSASDQLSTSAGGSDAGVGSDFARLTIGSPPTAAGRVPVAPLVFAVPAGEENNAGEPVGQPRDQPRQKALPLLLAPEEIDDSDAGSGSFEGLHPPSPTTPNTINSGSERAAESGADGRFLEGTRHDYDGHAVAAGDSITGAPSASTRNRNRASTPIPAACGATVEAPRGAENVSQDYTSAYGCGNTGGGVKDVILRAGAFLEMLEKAGTGEEALLTLKVDGGSTVKVVMDERKFLELHETKEGVGELLTTLGATCFAL
ncbi:unnamed protein product, partial [Ectocarpus fasciculatus]